MMLTSTLPSDLRAVIKQVKKKYYDIPNKTIETTDDYLWPLSMSEMGFVTGNGLTVKEEGDCYEGYTPGKVAGTAYSELIKKAGTKAVSYYTRSKWASGLTLRGVDTSGKSATITQGSSSSTSGFAFPCFCI